MKWIPLISRPQAAEETWSWYGEKSNDICRFVKPGVPGKQHIVDAIHASYQVHYIHGLLTWQRGEGEVVGRQYVHNQRDIYGPIIFPPGEEIAVSLHLSNKNVDCDVNPCLAIRGRTVDADTG